MPHTVVELVQTIGVDIDTAYASTTLFVACKRLLKLIAVFQSIEVIEHALRKTARKGAKWDYAITILDNYVEKNLNTLEKVQADEIEFKNRTSKNTEKEETEEEKTKRKIKELEEAVNANR